MCMTLATSAWSTPCARCSPASDSPRSCLFPRTLTNTRAWRKSGLVSTAVTVTKPIRGSLSPSAMRADRTSRRASLTLRMRSPGTLLPQYVFCGNDAALEANGFGKLREHVALEVVPRAFEWSEVTADECGGQRGPLPEIVVIGLRDRGAEAAMQLGFQGQQLLALPLERVAFGEVEVDLDDRAVGQLRAGLVRLSSRASARPGPSRTPR